MTETLTVNSTISHYRIVSKIGAGGMGEVYLALDTELDRTVAIKILPEALASDQQRLRRFVQEAKAASALNHPHILTIYEIGRTENSRFIATEFIDGETLRQRINAGMKLADILETAIQTCGALSAAHAAGIIHRDIKPENIMVRRDGYIKVLDFGLAKLTEPKGSTTDTEAPTRAMVNTDAGTVMGTANYMSPEQAKGTHVDARTDLWSLGAVLYEMITGHVPFSGETPTEAISLILQKEPAPLTRYAHDLPAELERIVTKALTKDREERYQTAKDMLIDLRNLKRKLEVDAEIERTAAPELRSSASTSSGQNTRATNSGAVAATTAASAAHAASSAEYIVAGIKQHKLAAAVAGILLVTALGVGSYLIYGRGTTKQINSIAVMPFVNESGNPDLEYLSDGMTETLITKLTKVPNLSVKARGSAFRYKGKEADPRTVGNELGVQAILNGRVAQRGDQLSMTVELIDTQTENVLWSEQYLRKSSDLLSLQSEIARDALSQLHARLTGDDEQKLARNYTANPAAHELYLKGRFHWNRRTVQDVTKSLGFFQQAVDTDPNYALAYVGLSDANLMLGIIDAMAGSSSPADTIPPARAAAERALAIDPNLAEAYASRGHVRWKDRDWAGAEADFKRSIEINPNYPSAHLFYALFLTFNGRFEEGISEGKRSVELDPYSVPIMSGLAMIYHFAGHTDEALATAKRSVEIDPSVPVAHQRLGSIYLHNGRYPEAIASLQKAVDLGNRGQLAVGSLAHAYAMSGNKSGALKLLVELERASKDQYVSHYLLATVYIVLDDKQRALELLEKAYTERSIDLLQVKVDPKCDPLREEPRFQEVIRKVNFP